MIKQVLVTTFGFTKTGFVLVLQGSSQNLSTKTFCFGFFLSHEPKLLPKLASPIRDENSQNIAYRYKTYIRRNQKKTKKVSVGCKDRHYYTLTLVLEHSHISLFVFVYHHGLWVSRKIPAIAGHRVDCTVFEFSSKLI